METDTFYEIVVMGSLLFTATGVFVGTYCLGRINDSIIDGYKKVTSMV